MGAGRYYKHVSDVKQSKRPRAAAACRRRMCHSHSKRSTTSSPRSGAHCVGIES
ncbi:uncharacterized protein PHACADRAFT_261283 [Phanerochaete carnosa HHB-10118-sp]|uniref:Uncharacterized protein n=1 Tax=Phanerochaete carnosa (strain HHB-10118-sp) TaxID=650164 RepID=K5W0R4_PHACS|nr:uncharacterized protein PHACADRAFT_261283 [Phanerochaete carnosa HHB-10118-sp]EKM52690.1 hypothetical protein PHACADRAFT_261283 [Phanerochaete carnosa HHB-10118-sp]